MLVIRPYYNMDYKENEGENALLRIKQILLCSLFVCIIISIAPIIMRRKGVFCPVLDSGRTKAQVFILTFPTTNAGESS